MEDTENSQTEKKTEKKFNFDKKFQEKIVEALFYDRVWATQIQDILNPDYFEYAYLKLVTSIYFKHYEKYKDFPSLDLVSTLIVDSLKADKSKTDSLLVAQIKAFLPRLASPMNPGDFPFVKEKTTDFCKRVILQRALEKSVTIINEGNYDQVSEIIRKALASGTTTTRGLDLFSKDDIDARYAGVFRKTVPTGIPELDQRTVLNGGLGGGEIGFVVAASGCHAKGTKILCFDGTWKNVEDIQIGDRLMGPDSRPRHVLRLVRGRDTMYRVTPKKGKPFIVNKEHILSVKSTWKKNRIENLKVSDILSFGKEKIKSLKLYRPSAISFQDAGNLALDPYIMGVLLGDGSFSSKRVEVTTADGEIYNSCLNFAKKNSMSLTIHPKKGNAASGWIFRGETTQLIDSLTEMNLWNARSGTKFIPFEYKVSSIQNRLEILAGLLDTDGHLHNKCYDFISKSERLACDVVEIAQSVGLAAYMRQCTKGIKSLNFEGQYYRVSISGNTDIVPCRIERKKALPRRQIKDVKNVGFSLEELPEDDFYGFTVDSDHLYVMEDFFVTHNCGKSHMLVQFGAEALKRGCNVLQYTFELNEGTVAIRYDSYLAEIDSTFCFEHKDDIKKLYEEKEDEFGRLIVKHYPMGSATVNTIRGHLERLKAESFIPDIILIDYAGVMRSTERSDLLRLELKKISEELKALADELKVPIWTALQANKEATTSEVVDMSNMAESFAQAAAADVILGLSRKAEQKAEGFGNLFVAKNRAGKDGLKYQIHIDTAQSRLRILRSDEEREYQSSKKVGQEAWKKILSRADEGAFPLKIQGL